MEKEELLIQKCMEFSKTILEINCSFAVNIKTANGFLFNFDSRKYSIGSPATKQGQNGNKKKSPSQLLRDRRRLDLFKARKLGNQTQPCRPPPLPLLPPSPIAPALLPQHNEAQPASQSSPKHPSPPTVSIDSSSPSSSPWFHGWCTPLTTKKTRPPLSSHLALGGSPHSRLHSKKGCSATKKYQWWNVKVMSRM